jgi:enamine deaminase RidA (YjgF/YER057c/UK114 family)
MGRVEKRLDELGLLLPQIPKPLAAYIPAKRVGNLVFTAGQLPIVNGELICKGLLGQDIQIYEAFQAARVCTLNALSAVKGVVDDLDKIVQIVRIVGYVAGIQTFVQQPAVINGASELILEIFGEFGKHARSAIGVSSLPLNASVEIELTLEVN